MDKLRSVESHIEFDCESEVEVDMDVSSVLSLRTAFTRSLAIRDHDSRRLWASQHGPRPLIIQVRVVEIHGVVAEVTVQIIGFAWRRGGG